MLSPSIACRVCGQAQRQVRAGSFNPNDGRIIMPGQDRNRTQPGRIIMPGQMQQPQNPNNPNGPRGGFASIGQDLAAVPAPPRNFRPPTGSLPLVALPRNFPRIVYVVALSLVPWDALVTACCQS
jgi:hypothetical protein